MTPVSTHAPDAANRLVADLLGGGPASTALIADDRTVSYAELRSRIADRAAELACRERSIVVLCGTATLEYVVTYLALLADGHVPLLAAQHAERLVDAWAPAAVVSVEHDHVRIRRTGAPQPDIHPDLALLLSTSGSTGNPKLVRLSHANIASNASAIATYLGLTSDDRAITSLPLHYCYGLSVLHSHLRAGAGVVVTTASVVDPCFRELLARHRVTNLAGVPHTFELAERAGADRLRVPSLRFLTVAGGRLDPDAVVRWAGRAEAWGAEFFVMYGQTEATARMAFLPPSMASRHPRSIGRAIPGGELRIEPSIDAPAPGVGELVYRGANVMMGYAVGPGDLALGACLDELRTGDLARFDAEHDLFEIVGRSSRIVKPFGLRVDLDALHGEIDREMFPGRSREIAIAGDDHVIALVAPDTDRTSIRRFVTDRTGLPDALVSVEAGPVPRTPSGKVDHAAIVASAHARATVCNVDGPQADRSVADVFATVLGRRDVGPSDTFVSSGGDSLGYIECSIRLERVIGRLPADWHTRPVASLESLVTTPRSMAPRPLRIVHLDSTALLRAVAICTVVATHMRVTYYPGGAHLLLALVGFNMSRFMAPIDDTAARARAGLRTAWRAAGPTVAWMAAGMAVFGSYSAAGLLLVNNYVGPEHHDGDDWHFWFIEVFVHLVVIMTGLLAIPAVRRLERRQPYGFVLGLLAATLVFRYGWLEIGTDLNLRFRTHGIAWFFVLGWLVHRSDSFARRAVTSAVVLAVVPGFFGLAQREWFIGSCLVGLVWLREVPLPRFVVAPVALVSTASMWILITHFTVWPPLVRALGRDWAYPATLAAGVLAWAAVRVLGTAVRRLPAGAPRGDHRAVPLRRPLVRIT